MPALRNQPTSAPTRKVSAPIAGVAFVAAYLTRERA
jgi:hypothetical protein